MRELIEELFAPALKNPHLDTRADAVPLPMVDQRELVVTTDGFTVQPLEFPGGNIGSLAVHGTVNDLAVSGIDIESIAPADDDVLSVYEYLIGTEEAVR